MLKLNLNDFEKDSDNAIQSYKIISDTPFYKQQSDTEFEKTSYIAKKDEVYDGIIVLKKNNKYYLDVGCDGILFCDLFIPIEGNPLNITRKE